MWDKLKTLVIGKARDPQDSSVFQHLSLVAFFAWVGLGADGLSSSAYGPEEAFLALHTHTYLGIFVALASVFTIFIISTSYSQIIELFPAGGGGYIVASKLLNPTLGMISGCALLIDYMLTITISVASGADALFSFLPYEWQPYKLIFALLGVLGMTVLNLRGAKESVIPLIPIFLTFVATHAFAILYSLISHSLNLPEVYGATLQDIEKSHMEIGYLGMVLMMLKAYSMGAGTYTGIEAVSNGMPILREPKVQTAKKTMRYMAFSLAFTVMGLILAYILYRVEHQPGKTLNAVLFESITRDWPSQIGIPFVLITLISEAALLFIAAQAGFLDGPRVLSNMALDRWFPSKFAMLSDRLVTQNGIFIMGGSALALMLLTGGSVRFLIVLYSINVFITFTLSQLGMVRHWWNVRGEEKSWFKKLSINGIGLCLCTFILVSVSVIKFHEGGWITVVITGSLIGVVFLIKSHYNKTGLLLKRLDSLVDNTLTTNSDAPADQPAPAYDPASKTAVLLVNGYNGLGLHTLFSVTRLFGNIYKNFIFVQVGVVDAGNFKGSSELELLETKVQAEVNRYVQLVQREGFFGEAYHGIGIDVVEEISQIAPKILEKYPNAVFFGGQLVFPEDTLLSRLLHNYTVFSMQRRFYQQGIPMVVLPIRV